MHRMLNAGFLIAHPGNDLNVHQQRLIRSVLVPLCTIEDYSTLKEMS